LFSEILPLAADCGRTTSDTTVMEESPLDGFIEPAPQPCLPSAHSWRRASDKALTFLDPAITGPSVRISIRNHLTTRHRCGTSARRHSVAPTWGQQNTQPPERWAAGVSTIARLFY